MSQTDTIKNRPGHPGKGRKRARRTPKGRQPNPGAIEFVQSLLGDRPLRRDLLIEYLHLVQDSCGHLSADNIAALAHLMKLSQTEVYEVATFYAHFDVIREGETPPPAVTVRVCDSIACQLAGALHLQKSLEQGVDASAVRVIAAPCMGRCDSAPVVEVGHNHIGLATPEKIQTALKDKQIHATAPEHTIGFGDYRYNGGYQTLNRLLDGDLTSNSVLDELDGSALRGLGGAGFPTGRKLRIVRDYPGPRLMAVNADEGEPGTFKDRHYLESDPHRFFEGMLIAARIVGAEKVYVYLRDEYPGIRKMLHVELQKIRDAGLADHVEVELRRGAGAYICGEESAMIESIEGKRGLPRNRPPYVAEKGLFGRPTLVNNVETLFWMRDIVEKGGSWFADAGINGRKGWRSYSVSGRIKKPGVVLAPAGVSARQLIEEYCGGMLEGHNFKGFLPGGASGGILAESHGDEPLDFGTLEQHGSFIGSAAVVVFSDHDNMRDVALNLMRFFEDESCGQCTPCRVGTEKAVKLMSRDQWDTDLLTELTVAMTDASICGLGQAAGNPINSVLKYFPEDFS